MKKIITSLLLLVSAIAVAQVNKSEVSNVQVRYRSTEDPNIPPVSVNDPAYNDRTLEMEITFTVALVDSVSAIDIKTGKTDGASDILNSSLVLSKEAGKNYYTYKNVKYEIKNGQVVFSERVPENTLKKSSYVSLSTTDRKNIKSKHVTKKLN